MVIWIIGQSGCGKTYLAKKALKRFELRNNVEMYNNIFLTI